MTVNPAKDDGSQPNIAPRPQDFWKDFRFLLTQDGEPLQYRNISGERKFSLGEGMSDGTIIAGVLVGAYVYLDCAARDVPSRENSGGSLHSRSRACYGVFGPRRPPLIR